MSLFSSFFFWYRVIQLQISVLAQPASNILCFCVNHYKFKNRPRCESGILLRFYKGKCKLSSISQPENTRNKKKNTQEIAQCQFIISLTLNQSHTMSSFLLKYFLSFITLSHLVLFLPFTYLSLCVVLFVRCYQLRHHCLFLSSFTLISFFILCPSYFFLFIFFNSLFLCSPCGFPNCQWMTFPFMFGLSGGFEWGFDSFKIIAGSLSDTD